MPHYPESIEYSEKYLDDRYEYRNAAKLMSGKPANGSKLLTEAEWRSIGVQQSRGWEHYEIHKRLLGTDPITGQILK